MFIKKSEYEEQQKEIKEIREILYEQKYKIKKLEFQVNTQPMFKVGETFGDWEVNNVSVYEQLYPGNRTYYLYNFKENIIKDFTENELLDLKKKTS
jgi:hypothetical protein